MGASGACVLGLRLFGRQVRLFLLQLQHRILLHLLLDPLLQRQDGQLQDLHRLDHPRRQHLLLHEPQVLTERKSHKSMLCQRLRTADAPDNEILKRLPAGQGVGQDLLVSKF